MRRVRVLHVVEDLPVGGLETTLYQIVTHLDPEIYDVRTCCIEEGGPIAEELQTKGYHVDILGLNNYYSPRQLSSLKRYLKKHDPDIVHTHGEFASTFGRIAALMNRTPVILRHIQTKANLKFRHRFYDGLLTRWTQGAVAVSENCAQHHIEKCRIPKKKMTVLPNGVDLEAFDNTSFPSQFLDQWDLKEQDILIGCVGRLSPIKGHIFMIRALPAILEKYPNTHLIIIGDGPDKPKLVNETKRLSVSDAVLFTGLRRDVPSLLKALRVFVLPSTEVEGLPLSIAEAMCAGVPVVASDVGGVSEIVRHSETGLLVAPKNPAQLSSAALKILGDPRFSEELVKNALILCRNEYSVETLVKRLESIYGDLLARKSEKVSMQSAISL
jgi:glycosyltransferase involved in cell wall biosynthesis